MMTKPSSREWQGILLAPLATAAFTALIFHLLTRPANFSYGTVRWTHSGIMGWSFSETFPQLLPTCLAISFVYHLTILPYVRSHSRRSALVLNALMGPAFALLIFTFSLLLFLFFNPGALVRLAHSPIRHFLDPRNAIISLTPLAITAVIFSFFALISDLLARRCDLPARSPLIPPDGISALRGFTLIGVIMLPLLFLWGVEHNRRSQRASCILTIRNVQQATRSLNGMNGISPGPAPGFSKNSLIGPGNFIPKEPFCPAGGSYVWIEAGRAPHIGELMVRCSHPDHNPVDYQHW